MQSRRRATRLAITGLVLVAVLAIAETRKDYRFTVGPRANVSVFNEYGPVIVRATSGNQVIVTATVHSDKVEIDNDQSGDRVEIKSHLLPGADSRSGEVDYEVQVPADASVTLHSATGPLHAEKLHGDVTLVGATASIEVRDVANGHVHVNTLSGPVVLSNIQNGHVEITSVGGDVSMSSVSGPKVQVSSTSGKISYDGDFGYAGEYSLMSHSGDIEATVPTGASFDVTARSVHGRVENDDVPFLPKTHTSFVQIPGSSFAGTIGKAASSVVIKTFSGKIRLKKR
ncbi:MAG TPA: DUF4097 family beta strand repeat-containing protein [Terriglobales bacterium]|nr:DUF4097 family beta strand repeat-containing protein [Terriglobales bacterium]